MDCRTCKRAFTRVTSKQRHCSHCIKTNKQIAELEAESAQLRTVLQDILNTMPMIAIKAMTPDFRDALREARVVIE